MEGKKKQKSENVKTIFVFEVEIDNLLIGERSKGSIFTPCLNIIPCSTVQGALYHYLGISIKAAMVIKQNTFKLSYLESSLIDKKTRTSKLPIYKQYLIPNNKGEKIIGEIIIPNFREELKNKTLEILNLSFYLGGMRSKGIGKAKIISFKKIQDPIIQGYLNTRIFFDQLEDFSINVISPRFGYLPISEGKHISKIKYKKSLIENSIVFGPKSLLKSEELFYDFHT